MMHIIEPLLRDRHCPFDFYLKQTRQVNQAARKAGLYGTVCSAARHLSGRIWCGVFWLIAVTGATMEQEVAQLTHVQEANMGSDGNGTSLASTLVLCETMLLAH